MTDELQQARADYDEKREVLVLMEGDHHQWPNRFEVQAATDAAFATLIEIATREYREALDRGRLALVDAAQALDYAARHIDRQAMGAMEKAREKALVAASALLPQPVPTQEVGE